jgi:hypothetical protein
LLSFSASLGNAAISPSFLVNFLDPISRRFLLLSFHGRSKWRCWFGSVRPRDCPVLRGLNWCNFPCLRRRRGFLAAFLLSVGNI